MKTCPICNAIYPTNFTVCPKDGEALRSVTEFSEGQTLRGKYQILAKLGQGGMGTVYKVRHLHFDEICALKVVGSHLTEDPGFLQRFRAEALVMRRLRHPNAVRVQDFDETEDGRPFMVMEYIEGQSLDKAMATEPPFHPRRAVRIASQICAALGEAHQLGIIHRDIKPANILLARTATGGEEVKVLDFGVAKVKESSTLMLGASLTRTGFVVGTPEYMSPEQARGCRGEEMDGRTDLYSLGIVLYEMLTGRLPYSADTPVMMLMAHVQSVPVDPRTLRADLPPPLVSLVLRALEKDPAQRFPSAEAMREALEGIEQDHTIRLTPAPAPSTVRHLRAPAPQPRPQPPPPPPAAGRMSPPGAKQAALPAREIFAAAEPTRPRSPWLYAGLGGLVVVALVIGVVLLRPKPSPTPPNPTPSPVVQPSPPAPSPSPQRSVAEPTVTPPTPEEATPTEEAAMKPEVRKLLQEGRQALKRGDPESATRFFRGALAIDPNNRLAQEGLRRAEQRKRESAQAPASRAGRQEEVQRLMQQGRQALDHGNYAEAIRYFQAVLDINPNHAEALRGLERARRAKAAEEEILRQR